MPVEETLDPLDWQELRRLGHRMLDDALDYLHNVRQRPAWQHVPDEVKDQFRTPVPQQPQPLELVYQEFLENILPYPVGNIHPRFWGWVFGTGTAQGALAELLAGVMNVGASGGLANHSAIHVEKQVVEWFKQLLGFPSTSGGLLTSGCSASNLVGLAVARNVMAGWDIRQDGLDPARGRLALYASQEIHSSVHKAVELLGLGSRALRPVPVNQQFQIDLPALQAAIAADRSAGKRPFCVVGAAGTTNTGAIDDLEALADLCQREGLWLHIDGAFGAWAALAPRSRQLVKGLERADSLAFDLHKWMYLPYDIGCILVRNPDHLPTTFSTIPDYLSHGEGQRGLTGSDLPWFGTYGIELSRSFRALKAWMSLKEHGVLKFGRLVQQNIDQAAYLARLVQQQPELELCAPVSLNVVCFRYLQAGLDDLSHDRLNKHIEVELQESGIAVVSGTRIYGRYVLHLANCNHRSRTADFDLLVAEVLRLGREYLASGRTG